ncbi:cell wall integrity scw1 [Chlorella sorokiniana]|jgi:hypothetical protein|uniref:Cell wall integrity scw1 n=1 Tax=Chlorella sorokiniana TaxID=3076 RepID=A0A2P6TXC5_CHLSO|nr:cell wall integrity scw1 [Chlorella sorokiniana]|eukprot:PRW58713.1 cell wall integrity scw1 [Chlorella sorokiniana]
MQGAYMTYSEPAESYQPAPPFYSIPIQAPAGFYYAPAPAAAPLPAADEVRTVFITGFPDDVKERELNNMLRFLPGYEASQMHFRNGQAQGFALFSTGSAARQAVDAVQNLVFDNDCVLRAEMAHKNMYLKDDPSLAPKRSRPSYEGGSYGGYPAAPPPGVAPPPGAYAYGPPAGSAPVGVVPPVQPRGYAPITNTKDNPPCNTLFIGNLGDGVNEAEIRGLFSHQPGFQQLKLVRGPKGVTCFIEFIDVTSAMAVHDAQQGAILASSDRGGIRIQYSKNPFGRKRDAAGAFVDPGTAAAGGGNGGMYGGRGEPHAADTPAQQPGQPHMPTQTI